MTDAGQASSRSSDIGSVHAVEASHSLVDGSAPLTEAGDDVSSQGRTPLPSSTLSQVMFLCHCFAGRFVEAQYSLVKLCKVVGATEDEARTAICTLANNKTS